MANRTYPNMEGTDTDRRPLPWSATMPNLDYSGGYSGAHSDITPASHHALSTAYDDLKKRYNDLQGRFTQAVKQLRDIQRRGSSPDVSGLTGSPRHHHRRSGGGVPPLEVEDPHNGDLGDLSLLSRERDLLERQVSELEHRLTEAGNSLADSEHETRQLREHVSRQEDDLRQNQRMLVHTETENEDLRKRLTLVKRQLRSSDSDRGAGAASAGSQGSSLNSSLTSSFDQGPFTSRSSSGIGSGADGSILGGELQNVLLTSVNLGSEMKELKSIVQKQRDIILMLIKRQNCEKENMKRRAELQRTDPPTCGIGARPKVRSVGLAASAVPSAGSGGGGSLPPSGSRGHLIQPVACTEDLIAQDNAAPTRAGPPHKDMLRSPLHHQRQRGPADRYSAPAMLVEPGSSGHSSSPSTHTTRPVVGGGPGMEHEPESHYDDLQFGGGVSVTWEQGSGGETHTEDMEPLLPSPPGRLGRNESMEHLHDDSPPYDSVGDLNSETSGSTLCGTDPEPEYDALEDASYRSVNSSTSEIENRFRSRSPRHQQRSLNIDRNEHRGLTTPGGVKPRSYDNVSQNVNLTTTPQDKYAAAPDTTTTTAGVGAGTGAPEQGFMNNNPLLASTHKPISQRNLYPPGPTPGSTRLSPEPTPPPRRTGRVPVEQASGEVPMVAPELRNCPVCNEDFPSLMAMDEFQKHVLECPGRTERICPMCNAAFPDEVSQDQFERHVNEHFEDDTTLQFEVLQS